MGRSQFHTHPPPHSLSLLIHSSRPVPLRLPWSAAGCVLEFSSQGGFYLDFKAFVAEGCFVTGSGANGVDVLSVQGITKEFAVGVLPIRGCLAQLFVEHVIMDEAIGLAEGMVRVAGPGILGGVCDHVGGHGIQFDIPVAGE